MGVKRFFVVVGSSPTVGVFGEWGVSTSISAHPHGTTQQTQVFAALACKHAINFPPRGIRTRGPGSGPDNASRDAVLTRAPDTRSRHDVRGNLPTLD